MPQTKYSFSIEQKIVVADVNRLTNQIWKIIPMKEKEENWREQLDNVIVEIAGLNEIFSSYISYLGLLSKLEGLKTKDEEIEFDTFRRTVFKCISLLRELCDYE